jgi:hypothetical protein
LVLTAALMLVLAAPAFAAEKRSVAFDSDGPPRLRDAAPPCGTIVTPEQAAAYLIKIQNQVPGEGAAAGAPPYYVPIAPHIVRQSDGTLGLSEARYNQAIADANLHFAGSGITFYTVPGGIDYIDSDAFYYDIDTYLEIDALRTTNAVPNAINIYFTEFLDYESGALCGISAFTFSSVQAIAMRNSCTANDSGLGNHSTFSHEIGHFFDLFHTHEPAFGSEYVDGSNCASAGDQLCDTPADPQLSSSTVSSGTCTYTGSATDPQGDPYAPDATLLMSYSLKHCRDNFSPESLTKVEATLVNDRPNLLTSPVDAPSLAEGLADGIAISSPRPNPTSDLTEMRLSLPASAVVDAAVFDVRGARVRTIASGLFLAGNHMIGWDGRDEIGSRAAPGIYFARIATGNQQVVRKIQLVR